MLFWMKRTWRSQTRPHLKHPPVEKEQPRRRKPARTGEVTAQMTLKQTEACWTVTGARLTVQSEMISDAFCVARVASLTSWSRRVRGKQSLTSQNLPVEAWVYFQFSFLPTRQQLEEVTIFLSVSIFAAVLPWRCFPVCQLSIFGDASIQTRRKDRVGQQDTDGCLKHWISHIPLTHYIPFFFFFLRIKTTSWDKIPSATTPLHIWWGFVFSRMASIWLGGGVTVWSNNMHNLVPACDAFSIASQIFSMWEFGNTASQWATVRSDWDFWNAPFYSPVVNYATDVWELSAGSLGRT